MIGLAPPGAGGALSVLALGAHADDLEIGCGGTLLRLARLYERLRVLWVVVGCSDAARANEAAGSARALLGDDTVDVRLGEFRDSFFPYGGGAIKEYFEGLKTEIEPDLIFTHYRHDLHQDHRLLCELTWNTFRDHAILEYEIPKYDGDLGSPNVFVPLDETIVDEKLRHLREHFPSQAERSWFTDELFRGLLRIRGMESNSRSGLAEAFYARKLVLDLAGTD